MADVQVRDSFYVDGGWRKSSGDEVIEVVNPATEQVIATVPAGTAADVDSAVAAARAAFPAWASTGVEERAKYLSRIQEALAARQDEIAAVITAELGAPNKLAKGIQAGLPIAVFGSYAAMLADYAFEERVGNSLVVREPIGVVAAITPWNYPLEQVARKVAPALAAGCTIVLKPSEVAPLAAYLLAEVLDEVGLPAGVFNLVTGYGPVVGEAMAAHPEVDMVSFTGSGAAGRRVSEVAAATVKRVALELGGKSANVILADADLTKAVKIGVANAFLNSGQTCTAWTRMLVPAAMHDEIVELATTTAAAYTVGDPTDDATRLGPVVSSAQLDRVRGYIEKGIAEGAQLMTGGAEAPEGLERGYYVRPTVFAGVRPDMTIAQEEIFGPVLSILPYDDEDDAVAIANGTIYGLAGAVWSADQDHAVEVARRLRTGQVDINGGKFNPVAPFGGYKQSGNGRELGTFGLDEFLEVKSLQL
ncbi:MAG: aldehyde dehydrogenase family protein [Actinomycetota bacterium]|nr:aldehyde dehydrogenase family protein [Actinomycetota bacterium]